MGTETTRGLRYASVVAEQKSTGLLATHTDALKTHSSQTFSTNLPEPKRVKTNTCHKLLAKNTVFLSCIVTKMKLQFSIWRCCENNLKRVEKGEVGANCGCYF
jgi:hypothetical protein